MFRFGFTALLVASMLGMSPLEAPAQRWTQTAQLELELEEGRFTVTTVLDTLTNVIERCDSRTTMPLTYRDRTTINCDSVRTVRRGPDQPDQSVSKLREQLIEEVGIAIMSASHVRIGYRFASNNRNFEETITSFQFLFRKGAGSEEIPLLYVDAEESWVRKMLRNKAIPRLANCPPPSPFNESRALVFAQRVNEGTIVKIAGEDVRDGFEKKKRQFKRKIQRLTYESQ